MGLWQRNIIWGEYNKRKKCSYLLLTFFFVIFSYIFETFFPFALHRYYCHHSLGKLRPLFLLSRLLKRLLPKRTFFCQLMGLWGKLGTIWNTIEIAEWNAFEKEVWLFFSNCSDWVLTFVVVAVDKESLVWSSIFIWLVRKGSFFYQKCLEKASWTDVISIQGLGSRHITECRYLEWNGLLQKLSK